MNRVMRNGHLGKIRMSPLMYGSLRYIATKHSNGTLSVEEVLELKQTQLRSFKLNGWITETGDRAGIQITKTGRAAIRSFEDNDEFFRMSEHVNLQFSALLNLVLPDYHHDQPARKPVAVATMLNRRTASAA